ncbi:PspA/IM30 family protein [Rhodobacter sp. NSM]|uniref:PspA/IM30 family protein n=1 Tax=Rhodobacter sp. NSM TaxID=3457501 RepID=UPI003FD5BA6E
MFRTVITLIRGQSRDAAEALTDAHAIPILRQQLRDCAEAVDAARRNVALVMAHAEREKRLAGRIDEQLADLEARALATYETEIARLRTALSDSETRLRYLQRGQRLAVATQTNQAVHCRAAGSAVASLEEAEATLARLEERQQMTEATRAAEIALSASCTAETMRDRLAAAGCGAPLRPDAAAVLARLRARSA